MMKRDPESQTRWKHKWSWHNRGHVWDKIATEWAGKEDWMSERKKKGALADKNKFATFALNIVKLSTAHRKEKGERPKETRLKRRHQGTWGLRTQPSTHAKKGRLCNFSETVRWRVNEATVNILWDIKYRGKRPCTHEGKGRLPIRFRRLMIS